MPSSIDYGHGIAAVDSGFVRPMLDAVHLVVEGDRAAVVDTASNESVPHVLAALAERGLPAAQVDWVMLTHVHLDHAGGAGAMMARFPNARLAVHPRGARHMIDPSRLTAATIEVYGAEAARRMYGDIVPVPAGRVVEMPDGATLSLNGRHFEFLDTPGHAGTTPASSTSVPGTSSRATPSGCRIANSSATGARRSSRPPRRCSSIRRPCTRRSTGCLAANPTRST